MKSLSAKTFQCGVTVQGLTTLSGTVYLTALTNTATWDYVVVGTTAQGQLYTRTYAQLMSDITSGIGLSGYVPTSRTLTINGVSYDLTANRSWTITAASVPKVQHQVKAGVAINKGQAVYVTSADGTNMIVGLASNASEATSSKTMGLLDATVSTNGFANVVTEGLLAGLDTSTAGTEGDPVWLGTGGNLIYGLINKPYAPAHLVFIGIVTRKNSNNGEIFVKVQNGFELKEIHDVDLITTTPVNGHLLGFNGTLWVNKTIAGWLGYTPANASGTTNYISKFTGSTTLGNSQIYDDGSNVGIGTTTMYGKLSISSGNSNGIRIDTNGGGYSALNIGGTGSLTVDAPGITGGRFQITDSGNVGIGTPSPGQKLDVIGKGVFGSLTSSRGGYSNGLSLQNNTGEVTSLFLWQSGVASAHIGSPANSTSLHIVNSYNTGLITDPNSIVLTNTGNVGIGTISPTGKLQIADDGPNALVLGSTQISIIGETNDGGYPGMKIVPYNSNIHIGISSTNDNKINLWYGGTNYTYWQQLSTYSVISNYSTNALVFQVHGGNVGIGTTSPYSKLEITPSSVAWGEGIVINPASGYSAVFYRLEGAQGSNYTGTWAVGKAFSGDGGGELLQVVKNGLTGSAAYRADASQQWKTNGDSIFGFNVGIGTTSPVNKFVVSNAGASGLEVDPTGGVSSGVLLQAYNRSTSAYMAQSYYALTHTFNVGSGAGTRVLDITSAGNVGIGTSSPNEKLHVTGNIHAYAAGGIDSGLFASTSAGSTTIAIRSNGVTHFNGGNVGIGTNSPKAKFQINNGHIAVYHNVSTDGAQIYLGDTNFDNSGYWNSAPGIGSVFSPGTTVAGDLAFYVYTGVSNSRTERMRIIDSGNVGIGTTTPSTKLDVSGVITATGGNSTNWNTAYGWGNHSSAGYVPQARTLTINGTSYDLSANRSWTIATTTPGGSDTQFQYNSSGSLAGASALTYNSTTNRVGINQASPGYDLDVNGQVRVQDKLRVGTGNGVVHMSSTATINASATTVVWAQTVSVGMCAFIEYYILNNNSLTDQRAGTIMVTWNQSGTPTIAHTETTTPDIGSTTSVNFTSSLVGSDARINAVNSSANPYTIVMSYKYF